MPQSRIEVDLQMREDDLQLHVRFPETGAEPPSADGLKRTCFRALLRDLVPAVSDLKIKLSDASQLTAEQSSLFAHAVASIADSAHTYDRSVSIKRGEGHLDVVFNASPPSGSCEPSEPAASPETERILVVHDDPLMQTGLATLLDDYALVFAEPDEEIVLHQASETSLAIVVLRLGDDRGLQVMELLRQRHPELPIIAVVPFADAYQAHRAVEMDLAGGLTNREAPGLLTEAVRAVGEGASFWSPMLENGSCLLAALTDRERDVFRLCGEGLSNQQVADRLFISKKTVDRHRENIKNNLELASTTELDRLAIRWRYGHGIQS